MKKNLLLFIAIAAIAVTGCKSYDGDIDDLNSRVSSLEQWRTEINSDITELTSIVNALKTKDYVTGVKALSDGTGYTITFQNSGSVTIKNGEKGATPVIGVKKDSDGEYYWTVDGSWLLNDGKKIPTTGEDGSDGAPGKDGNDGTPGKDGNDGAPGKDGLTPFIGANGNWWIGTKDLGIKAQGDAIFAKDGIDLSNEDYVVLTLADGETMIELPRYKAFKIGMDDGNAALIVKDKLTVAIKLPAGFKAADYTAIMAEVKCGGWGSVIDIATKFTDPFSVNVKKPSFKSDGTCNDDASVTVIPFEGLDSGTKAMLEVTLVGSDGSKLIADRVLVNTAGFTDPAFIPFVIKQVTGLKDEDGNALTEESKAIPLTEENLKTLDAFAGSIACSNATISSLNGIELLPKLTSLDCPYNNLSSLDISNNTSLTELSCYGNSISYLDVSNNTNLTSISCSNNNLSKLDVSNNTKLTHLIANTNNLTFLDVSKNTSLKHLLVAYNNLTTLDVSHNIALFDLQCYKNKITTLDLSKNNYLSSLVCINNKLKSLDVSNNTNLSYLQCSFNDEIKSLDLSKNTKLKRLECIEVELQSLTLPNTTTLTDINCSVNSLTALDLSNNTAVTKLDCSQNDLTSLDLSKNTALLELTCGCNYFATLDLSNNTALTKLNSSKGSLTSLDLTNNTALTNLYCNYNLLDALNISMLAALKEWTVGNQTDSDDNPKTLQLTLTEAQKTGKTATGNDGINYLFP